jgi:hypothetical protein
MASTLVARGASHPGELDILAKQYGYLSLFRYATTLNIVLLTVSGLLALAGGALIVFMPVGKLAPLCVI